AEPERSHLGLIPNSLHSQPGHIRGASKMGRTKPLGTAVQPGNGGQNRGICGTHGNARASDGATNHPCGEHLCSRNLFSFRVFRVSTGVITGGEKEPPDIRNLRAASQMRMVTKTRASKYPVNLLIRIARIVTNPFL